MGVNTLPKLNFSVPFAMTSALPLDWNSYFTSLTEAQAAAATADVAGSSTTVYYYGQQIMVVEGGVATLYVIQPDKTLKAAGSALTADGTSIAIVDGQVQILGFAAAETGAQPRKKADGTIEWIKPDTTTVEGLQTAVEGLESDVESLTSSVESNTAAIETLNGTGEGSVSKQVADAVAQIVSDAPEAYDTLKEISDWISSHAGSAAEMNSAIQSLQTAMGDKVDKVEGKQLSTEDYTTTEKTKLSGIAEGAQVNAIDAVSSEFVINPDGKTLSVQAIDMDKITGLSDALAARENVIEAVQVNGTALSVSEKTVNIPLATADAVGLVKSASEENTVAVGADGTMTVNDINISKLTQTSGDVLVLDGGSSAND